MLGLLGGTFDPVHFGHLRPALDVLDELGLSELRLIPSHTPPHRQRPGASAEQRLDMVRLAVAEEPRFRVDEREIHRQGPSYMVDTLTSFRQELGEDTALLLIVGIDAFLGLPQWHQWQRILELAHLVVTHRPGWQAPDDGICGQLLALHQVDSVEALAEAPAGSILMHRVTQLEISATRVRDLLGRGQSARFLLPEAVLDYIEDRNLYR